MRKGQILGIVVAIFAIIGMYNLPKSIINKTNKEKLGKTETANTADLVASSAKTISENDLKKIGSLRKFFLNTRDIKKSTNFADSLAMIFISLQKFDSAIVYADKIVLLHQENKNCLKTAGNIAFAIYSAISEPQKATLYAEKARNYYQQFLKTDSSDFEVRNNLAMTYVVSNTPMQAIMELRKVLAAQPSNEQAQFNLGLLAIQSGQFDKAINRFKTLVVANAKNWKAKYYLAISYLESGKNSEAKTLFSDIAENANDISLMEDAKNNLKNLN